MQSLYPAEGFDVARALRDDASVDRLRSRMAAWVDPDVEVVATGSEQWPGIKRTGRGFDIWIEAWRDWLTGWETVMIHPEGFRECGDQVLVLVRLVGSPSREAPVVEQRSAALWTVRGGRIVRIEEYLEREEGLRAAGIG